MTLLFAKIKINKINKSSLKTHSQKSGTGGEKTFCFLRFLTGKVTGYDVTLCAAASSEITVILIWVCHFRRFRYKIVVGFKRLKVKGEMRKAGLNYYVVLGVW